MIKKKSPTGPPAPLGALLPSVLQGIGRQVDIGLLKVWEVWRSAVGADIADNAQPAAFKGDVLIVHVSNTVWSHHLQFLKKDLRQQLNQALGWECVRDIKFKIGSWSDGSHP